MKKLVFICLFSTIALALRAQGVNFINTPTTRVSTNAVAIGGGIDYTAPPGHEAFRYALLTAPSTVGSVDPSLQQLLSPTWSFTGLYGTNLNLFTGRLTFTTPVQVPENWSPGVDQSFVVIGWSANLADSWSDLAYKLDGATFDGSSWQGENLSYSGPGLAFLGASMVGHGPAGGTVETENGPSVIPPLPLFATTAPGNYTPITNGFSLYVIVPEPVSVSLFALGGLAIASANRRKTRV